MQMLSAEGKALHACAPARAASCATASVPRQASSQAGASAPPQPSAARPGSPHASKVILHSDMNCFYAAVECCEHPELRELPVVVGGDEEARHGIVLAKNQIAKSYGIKTGECLWQAREKCPGLVVRRPDYPLYLHFSRMARAIYYDYTDLVEPFGPDEAWLDVTGSMHLWGGDAYLVAHEISERIKAELGLTVSIGISWNKIFAKFGSDYRKPDAITPVTSANYKSLVWEAPVEDLLYVGPATKRKLNAAGMFTIGDVARAPRGVMRYQLGKIGEVLQVFALGEDATPVKPYDPAAAAVEYDIKSIGNGLTAPHDITNPHDAKLLIYLLSQSVAQRLRQSCFLARTVCVHARAADLTGHICQAPLERPSDITGEIAQAAFLLLQKNEPLDEDHPLRALGVRATGLVPSDAPQQFDLFGCEEQRARQRALDAAVDGLRHRFGNNIVRLGPVLGDPAMSGLDIKRDNIVHPVGFFNE